MWRQEGYIPNSPNVEESELGNLLRRGDPINSQSFEYFPLDVLDSHFIGHGGRYAIKDLTENFDLCSTTVFFSLHASAAA